MIKIYLKSTNEYFLFMSIIMEVIENVDVKDSKLPKFKLTSSFVNIDVNDF